MVTSTTPFCTMGGMMPTSDGSSSSSTANNNIMSMYQRKLWERSINDIIDITDDVNTGSIATPVILPEDNSNDGENHMDGHEHDEQHDDMHGDMNHEMNQDHQSHSMSNHMHTNQGTAMYMDGFHSALFHSSQTPPPCLVLFLPSWTLNTPSRFISAMVCVTVMGMLVEACGVWRVKILRKGKRCREEIRMKLLRQGGEQQHHAIIQGQQLEFVASDEEISASPPNAGSAVATSTNTSCPPIIRRMWRTMMPEFIRTICAKKCCCFFCAETDDDKRMAKLYDLAAVLLHTSRAGLGYLLMLAVMTYSVEFFLCAVLGMVLGRYWFVNMESSSDDSIVVGGVGGGALNGTANGEVHHAGGGNDGTWGGGDPCCGIDEDELDEYDSDSNQRGALTSSLTRRSGLGRPIL